MANTNLKQDLTNLEFATLSARARALISQATPYWTQYQDSDPGIVLIDLVSALGDLFSYYLDKRTDEMILTRARTKKSVIDQGNIFDYRLQRAVAPTVDVLFTVSTPLTADTTIPEGTSVTTDSDTTYITRVATLVHMADASASVTTYEGKYFSDVFTSDGSTIQLFQLTGVNVSANFLDVYVTHSSVTTLWQEDQITPPIDPDTTTVYIVNVDQNGVATIQFNGNRYTTPSNGDIITVNYVTTDGPSGAINAGNITAISTTFSQSDSFTVTNLLASTTGVVEEDFTQIQYKIPMFLATLQRAVSLNDYKYLAQLYNGVLSANAIQDVATNNGLAVLIYIVAVTPGGESGLITPLQTYLQEYSVIGVIAEVVTATFVNVDISISLVTQPRAVMSTTQAAVQNAINALMARSNRSIGQSLYLDDVYAAISTVPDLLSYKVILMDISPGTNTDDVVIGPDEFIVPDSILYFTSGGL